MRWLLVIFLMFGFVKCELLDQIIAEQTGNEGISVEQTGNAEGDNQYFTQFTEYLQKLPTDKAKEEILKLLKKKLKDEGKSDTEAAEAVSKVDSKLDDFINAAKNGTKWDALLKFFALMVALYGVYKGGKGTTNLVTRLFKK